MSSAHGIRGLGAAPVLGAAAAVLMALPAEPRAQSDLSTGTVNLQELLGADTMRDLTEKRERTEPARPTDEELAALIEGTTGARVTRFFARRESSFTETAEDGAQVAFRRVEATFTREDASGRWEFKAMLRHTGDGWVVERSLD